MESTSPNEGLEKYFEADGYRMAKEHLGEKPGKDQIIALSEGVYSYIDEIADLFLKQCGKVGQVISCRRGCSWCCYQAVFILPSEAIYLVDWMSVNLNKADYKRYTDKLKEKNQLTSVMHAREFIHYKMDCAFLKDGICMVYPARPLSCRSFISASETSCYDEYLDPTNLQKFPALYDLPLQASRNINKGIAGYLSEIGIVSFEWLFESSVLTAFNQEKVNEWLNGNDSFMPRIISEDEFHYINTFEKT
jgi:Fe-S-cluster containining protein